ncbi:hypothetical protein BJP34_11140 [Moorena producens PAL-8-15-08-1]|uniref:Uncharacterized protein n=1 Tax=Moorena producens PAL-8-15-08-1 TaxID=1458985 RepID=A0A1D8TQT3_9CYAN|nr:hypothetical protein [Moorena producens]AOW99933.1 hypothetical protein BJP34_11140 [Moorena producens PAL-8-15-08-1]
MKNLVHDQPNSLPEGNIKRHQQISIKPLLSIIPVLGVFAVVAKSFVKLGFDLPYSLLLPFAYSLLLPVAYCLFPLLPVPCSLCNSSKTLPFASCLLPVAHCLFPLLPTPCSLFPIPFPIAAKP